MGLVSRVSSSVNVDFANSSRGDGTIPTEEDKS